MNNKLYEKIETQIKNTDFQRRANLTGNIFLFIIMISFFISGFILVFHQVLGVILCAIMGLSSLIGWYLTTYVNVYKYYKDTCDLLPIKSKKLSVKKTSENQNPSSKQTQTNQTLKFSDFFRLRKIIRLSWAMQRIRPSILEIIKECGITTKDGLEEAIEHYRFEAQSTKRLRIDLLVLLPLAVSIIDMLFNNQSLHPQMKTLLLLMILGLIMIYYLGIYFFYKSLLASYGKKAFYKYMENSLSELRAQNVFGRKNTKVNKV